MTHTIQVKLTEQRCERGDAYAQKHMTTPPKAALLSCEGMCLRGDVARRAANLVAQEMAPEKTVRICHGGLLETSDGMRELVHRADQVVMLDGCSLACGTRLLKGAFPEIQPTVVFTDQLVDLDDDLFGVDEMPEADIKDHARTVANKVLATTLSGQPYDQPVTASSWGGAK
jgi:uncharacterized metal-binding protein